MNEGTDITKWMKDKGFPYPLKEAKVFKWYMYPLDIVDELGISLEEALKLPKNPFRFRESGDPLLHEVLNPKRIAIHLKPDGEESLDQDFDIAWWIVDNMPPAQECGVYDDRPANEDVVLDVFISWEDLKSLLQKG